MGMLAGQARLCHSRSGVWPVRSGGFSVMLTLCCPVVNECCGPATVLGPGRRVDPQEVNQSHVVSILPTGRK